MPECQKKPYPTLPAAVIALHAIRKAQVKRGRMVPTGAYWAVRADSSTSPRSPRRGCHRGEGDPAPSEAGFLDGMHLSDRFPHTPTSLAPALLTAGR